MKPSGQFFKKTLTPSILGLLVTIGAMSASPTILAQEFDKQVKDMTILMNIFKTVLNEADNIDHRRVLRNPPQPLYLAGQGMMFTFSLDQRRGNFWSGNLGINAQDYLPDLPDLPDLPNLPNLPALTEVEANLDVAMDFAYEELEEMYDLDLVPATALDSSNNPNADAIREKRRAISDQRRKLRDQQTQLRSLLERNHRGENGDLDQQLNSLRESLAQARKDLDKHRQELQAVLDQQEAARQARHNEQSQILLTALADALCDYGSTLRSLKNEEKLNLVLENFTERGKSQLYIFDGKSLKNCQDSNKLLNEALSYSI